MRRMLYALFVVPLLLLALQAAQPAAAAPELQGNCRTFTETGFEVCDDAQARFLGTFNNYGLQNVGYPVSNRYERDGFVTQAFQKAIFQWRADSNSVAFVNIFDDLHRDGFDERLYETRQTPYQMEQGPEGPDSTFEQAVAARQALLDERPALRQAYFAVSNPLLFFGLPTSEVEDMGNHYAIRLQRAVLQEWKEDVPWARAGQVTVANGGDIAKELGALPTGGTTPGGSGTPPSAPVPPTAVAQDPFEKRVPLGEEFITTLWGVKLYDVKRAKAVYFFDEAAIAHGTYLIAFVEFRNLGSGTSKPSSTLDFYLQDAAGRTYDFDIFMDSYALLGASWQFQAGHIYDRIHPGSVLGVAIPWDISPQTGDIWLRIQQYPDVLMYLGNVSEMPETR